MKRLLILFCFISSFYINASAEYLDVDYNFIDNAFNGIKPVTDKEFNDTINRLTPQPVENTFKGKLKAFLFGRKYGTEQTIPKTVEDKPDIGGERQAIQEIKNGIYFIRISAPIISLEGNIIPLGDYKIKEKKQDENDTLVFYQGAKEYGSLKLSTFDDNLKNENDIAYSRVDIINDSVIRIVYSTIKETKCAYAKVFYEK